PTRPTRRSRTQPAADHGGPPIRRHAVWRLLLVLAAIAAAGALVLTRPPRLGLDLRGGTQIVLEAKDAPGQPADDDAVERALEVLRRRVDALGVSEPSLQRSGARRIIIELPGVTDPQEAVDVIGRTAQLAFRPVLGPGGSPAAEGADPAATPGPDAEGAETVPDEDGAPIRVGPVAVTGDAVRGAEAKIDPEQGVWYVDVSFRGDGADRWTELTAKAACAPLGDPTRRIAILLDREVISSPQVDASIACDVGIRGGQTSITGGFDQAAARDLALLLRAGALPVPVETVEQRTVGATLGEEAVRASTVAGLIGASMTVLYMLVYYRVLGVLAAVGLAAYALLSFALLLAIRATLTLPGVAGFVLAVGMAVDANVLVFERIKEEYAASGKIRAAVQRGFTRAWSAIADSNATTLLAAGLLFWLASGPVRGFGITLTVGVVVSMFTALVVTRLLAEAVGSRRWTRRHPGALGLSVGGGLRARLAQSPPDLIGRSKLWAAISAVAIVASIAGIVGPGLQFGLEFTGGRLLAYATERRTELDDVRAALAERGFPRAVVQHADNDTVVVRTGVIDGAGEEQVAAAVQVAGGATEEVRDEFIGPTLGQELRRKALTALALALAAQMAYLAMRFRWTYGLSAVGAMFHDVVLLVGVFAWMGKEIDSLFLAALLTVIGYSINDSVVVFDRIREQRQLRPTEPVGTVANDACLQTIPRTINTGLGALFILLMLYVLGGETLTDFALALLIGIVVGTYSSIF
ncbi:MAG: protein translocase subunit SecD, partial [Actinomycetota bacterium]